MTARQVHALLAAGLENPGLISSWQQEPGRLRRYGVEPESLDLSLLWKFAGLMAKVRHNGLRDTLPMTFRLLNVAGLEIEVFAAYASLCAEEGRRFAATTTERMRDLMAFLDQWLDRKNLVHVVLWDLIRHENAIAQLTEQPVTGAETVRAGVSPRRELKGRSVPHVYGHLHLCEMQCDPRAVVATLRESKPDLDRIGLGSRCVGYWRPDGVSHIRILELDELGYYTLNLIDGVNAAVEIDQSLGGSGRTLRGGFLRLLRQLEAEGIIGFDHESQGHEAASR
jgi:hypothetical protein